VRADLNTEITKSTTIRQQQQKELRELLSQQHKEISKQALVNEIFTDIPASDTLFGESIFSPNFTPEEDKRIDELLTQAEKAGKNPELIQAIREYRKSLKEEIKAQSTLQAINGTDARDMREAHRAGLTNKFFGGAVENVNAQNHAHNYQKKVQKQLEKLSPDFLRKHGLPTNPKQYHDEEVKTKVRGVMDSLDTDDENRRILESILNNAA